MRVTIALGSHCRGVKNHLAGVKHGVDEVNPFESVKVGCNHGDWLHCAFGQQFLPFGAG